MNSYVHELMLPETSLVNLTDIRRNSEPSPLIDKRLRYQTTDLCTPDNAKYGVIITDRNTNECAIIALHHKQLE